MNIVASTVVFAIDDLASSRHFTTHLGFARRSTPANFPG